MPLPPGNWLSVGKARGHGKGTELEVSSRVLQAQREWLPPYLAGYLWDSHLVSLNLSFFLSLSFLTENFSVVLFSYLGQVTPSQRNGKRNISISRSFVTYGMLSERGTSGIQRAKERKTNSVSSHGLESLAWLIGSSWDDNGYPGFNELWKKLPAGDGKMI